MGLPQRPGLQSPPRAVAVQRTEATLGAVLGFLMFLASPVIWYLAATTFHSDLIYWAIWAGWVWAINLALGTAVRPPQ
jgi:hypothetical protein